MDLVGIKYALNAALGNSGFQALDELIESIKNEIVSTLKEKKYVSSSSLIKSDSYSGSTFSATGSDYQQTKILDFYVEHNGVVKITVNTTNKTGITGGDNYGFYKVVVGNPDDPIYESSEINGDVDFTTNVPVVAYRNYNIFVLSKANISRNVDIGCTSASVKVYGTLS